MAEEDRHVDVNCSYSLAVRTSDVEHETSRGSVYVQLIDEQGNTTDNIKLKCSISHRRKYQRGHSDLFILVDQRVLGKLKTIRVTHRKRNREDGELPWHVHSILVIHHLRNEIYRFEGHQWLGNTEARDTTIMLDAVAQPTYVWSAEAEATF